MPIHYKANWQSIIALIGATVILLTLTLQYPFSVTFPIGGDAPSYITYTKMLLGVFHNPNDAWYALTHTWYPLAYFYFAPFALIPISWPMRFVWWAATGYVISGAALGWLIYRIGGWKYAAASIALWALVPIAGMRHFEDATIAQLWSYTPFFLFIERFYSKKTIVTLILLVITCLSHPITAIVLLTGMFAFIPAGIYSHKGFQPADKRFTIIMVTAASIMALAALAVVISRASVFNVVVALPQPSGIFDYMRPNFIPIAMLAPIGLIFLLEHLRNKPHALLMMTCIILSSTYFGLNGIFGHHVWEVRFYAFFVMSLIILASFSLPHLVHHIFPSHILASAFLVCFFSVMAITNWSQAAYVYNFYESSSRYGRLHSDEISGIEWMINNLPSHSKVYVTNTTRHSEWIQALTDFQVQFVDENSLTNGLIPITEGAQYHAFFTHTESFPKDLIQYPMIYQNQGFKVIQLNS